MKQERPVNLGVFKFIKFFYFGRYKFIMLLNFLLIIVGSYIHIFQPKVMAHIISKIQLGSYNLNHIILLMLFVSLLDLREIVSAIQTFCQYIIQKANMDVKAYSFNHLLQKSNSFFNNNYVAVITEKLNFITNDFTIFYLYIIEYLKNFGVIIVSLFYITTIDYFLLFITVIWLLTHYCIIKFFNENKLSQVRIQLSKLDKFISGAVEDCFININSIKTFQGKQQEIKKLISFQKQKKQLLRTQCLMRIKPLIFSTINDITFVLLSLWYAIDKVKNNSMSVENFILLIFIIKSFIDLEFVFFYNYDFLTYYTNIKQGLTIFDEDSMEIKDKKDCENLTVFNGKIHFKNINFNYVDNNSGDL